MTRSLRQWMTIALIGALCVTVFVTFGNHPANASENSQTTSQMTTGAMGITETNAQIMARQVAKDKAGIVEPRISKYEMELDYLLPDDPNGQKVAKTGFVPNAVTRAPGSQLPQTVGVNFSAHISSNGVPPDTQGAIGPSQFLLVDNANIFTFNKTTGVADGALSVTVNTFFTSVNGGASTFDPIARYDRLSQRYFITAENGAAPNEIYVAVSNTSTITSSSAWTFFEFNTKTVSPALAIDCFGDYPTSAVDANSVIIGVNNFCPTNYNSSDVFAIRKSSVLSGGPIVVTAFRAVGMVTPRGVDSWDNDSTSAPSYVIGAPNSITARLRQITGIASGTPTISGSLNVTVPSFTSPIALDHLGKNSPGGAFNGKVDASDTRFMPAVKRNNVIWAAHGSGVNSSGVASAVDRDGVRWYQITNPDTTPVLAQSGTIFDSAATNPNSYTYPGIMTSGQGHTAFGFSVIGTTIFNSAGHTGRLVNDAAGFTNTPLIFKSGAGAYNAFDIGTSRAQRWGDYSQSSLDPCDDMTIWTVQEFTGQANTTGNSNAKWGQQVAQLIAPPPPATANLTPSPASVVKNTSVTTTINASGAGANGFYNTPSVGADACRKQISATATNGVTVNSITYNNANQVTLDLNTSGASGSSTTVTIKNPDDQTTTVSVGILTPTATASITNTSLPTLTSTNSVTPTKTNTSTTAPTLTSTNSVTPSKTNTATTAPTLTSTNSVTPSKTNTPTTTSTPAPRPDTIGVYKDGIWFLRNTNNNGVADITAVYGGDPTDLPVTGDWNGDGIDTIGVYRGSLGNFLLSDSNTAPAVSYLFTFGNPGDIPFAGRWTADMSQDGVGVYRSSNGVFFEKKLLSTGFNDFFAVFGDPGNQAVSGDWDGNGLDSIGLYRSSTSTWLMTNNGSPSGITLSDITFDWDIGAARPVVGDWDINITSTVGYFASTGVFVLHSSNTTAGTDNIFAFGPTDGYPLSGKWVGLTTPPSLIGLVNGNTGFTNDGNSGGAE